MSNSKLDRIKIDQFIIDSSKPTVKYIDPSIINRFHNPNQELTHVDKLWVFFIIGFLFVGILTLSILDFIHYPLQDDGNNLLNILFLLIGIFFILLSIVLEWIVYKWVKLPLLTTTTRSIHAWNAYKSHIITSICLYSIYIIALGFCYAGYIIVVQSILFLLIAGIFIRGFFYLLWLLDFIKQYKTYELAMMSDLNTRSNLESTNRTTHSIEQEITHHKFAAGAYGMASIFLWMIVIGMELSFYI